MRSNTRSVVLGLAAALLVPATGALGQAASPVYRHPLGFTLVVPAGWSVAPGERNSLQLTPRDKGSLEAYIVATDRVSGIGSVADPRMARELESDLLGHFPFLERVGESATARTGLGAGTRLAWEGESPTGVAVRAETYVTMRGDRAIVLVAVGPRERIAARAATLRALWASFGPDRPAGKPIASRRAPAVKRGAGSARLARGESGTPLARAWRQRFSGKKLTYMSSYSSGSSGGYSSRYDLYLDPSGRFVFRGNSSVSVYVPGASGGSAGQEAKEGTWRIVSRGGQAILELMESGQKPDSYVLTLRDGKTFLNGTRFFVTDP